MQSILFTIEAEDVELGLIEEIKKPYRALKRAWIMQREAAGDRAWRIDTGVPQFLTAPQPVTSPYEPMHYHAFESFDAHVPVTPDEVFYDLGCGKGRVLCHFARKPIRKAIGVEYDEPLVRIAETNLETLAGKRAESSVVLGDAAAQDYSDATLVFMFNPFGPDTMRGVLNKLVARPGVRIAYVGPVQEAVFSDFPSLKIVDQFTVPYDLGQARVIVWKNDG